MSRTFRWDIVQPDPPGGSISLRAAYAIAEALDIDDADIDGVELSHSSLPALRAIRYLVSAEDAENFDEIIKVVSASGGVVRFRVER